MIRYGSTPSSCAKDLTISEATGATSLFNFHSRVIMYFHAPLRPRKMDKFLFLGTHTRFVTTKKRMVTPPLTTSFMNFIVIKIHVMSYRDRICNLLSSCIAGKDLPPWKGWFIRIDMRWGSNYIALPESMLYIWNRLTSLLLSWYNPLPAEPPFLLGPQRKNIGLVPTVHHGRKDSPSRDH